MVLEVGSELLLEVVERDEFVLDNDGDLELLDSVSDGDCSITSAMYEGESTKD